MPKNTDEKNSKVKPPETMASLVWRRFRRHPGAMIGAIILSILIISVTFANLSPHDPEKSDIVNKYQPPSWGYPFGTDGLGRDMVVRVLYGGRASLAIGFMVVGITLSIGVPIGCIAGYFGGWIDSALSKVIDATLSLPSLMFLILLSAILREKDLPFVKSNSVMTIAVSWEFSLGQPLPAWYEQFFSPFERWNMSQPPGR